MSKWFTTLPRDYYKSNPQWFIVGGINALVRSTKMNTVVYVVRAAGV
jgi:hypothetical protein